MSDYIEERDTDEGVSPKPKGLGSSKGFGYSVYVLGLMLLLFAYTSYVSTLGYAILASFSGLLLLYYWRYAKAFLAPLLILAVGVLWILWRSDPSSMASVASGSSKLMDQQWARTVSQCLFYPALILAAWRLKGFEAKILYNIAFYVVVALSALLLFEAATQASLYQWISAKIGKPIRPDLALVATSMPTYALLMLYWPLLMVQNLIGAKRLILIPLACLLVAPMVMSANAVTSAFFVSICVYFLTKYWSFKKVASEKFFAVFVNIFILCIPALVFVAHQLGWIAPLYKHLPASWAARTHIWEVSVVKLFEHPLIGSGFDFSRHFADIPLHPHNMSIQIALELGYIGLSIAALFWNSVINRIGEGEDQVSKQQPQTNLNEDDEFTDLFQFRRLDAKPYFLATAAAFFVIANLSFGVWQEWFVALGAITITIALIAKRCAQYEVEMAKSSQNIL